MPVIQQSRTDVRIRLYWVGVTLEDAITRPSFPSHNHAKFEQISRGDENVDTFIYSASVTIPLKEVEVS